jgi:hypothetical protein
MKLFLASALAFAATASAQECQTGIVDFTVINADSDSEIGPFAGFDFSTLPSDTKVNIRANPVLCNDDKIKSVLFFLNDEVARCEEWTPYALFGDENPGGPDLGLLGKFYGSSIIPDLYTVRAVAFPEHGCVGDPYVPVEQTVCGDCPGKITGFTVIVGQDEQGPLSNFDFPELAPGVPINIRADFEECEKGPGITSVQFYLDGVKGLCEEWTPYALFGDENPNGPDLGDLGNFYSAFVNPGVHSLLAVPFDGDHCTGTSGCPLVEQFEVKCKECPGNITSFSLINADKNKVVGPLKDFDFATIAGKEVNIRANFNECNPVGIESVQFYFDGVKGLCEEYTPCTFDAALDYSLLLFYHAC